MLYGYYKLFVILMKVIIFSKTNIRFFLINCRLNTLYLARIVFSSFLLFTHARLNDVSQLVASSNGIITIVAEQCRIVNDRYMFDEGCMSLH